MFQHLKHSLSALALLLALSGAAHAAGPPTLAPDVELKAATEQLRGLIRARHAEYKAHEDQLDQAVDEVLAPRFDPDGIARLVLSGSYRSATAEQRARFAAAFRHLLVRTYAKVILDNYDSVSIAWAPPRIAPNATDATVNAALARDAGQADAIAFRVHLVDGDWKIYDVIVDNVSLMLNFRTQFGSEIKRTSLDEVIARIEAGQVRAASSGS